MPTQLIDQELSSHCCFLLAAGLVHELSQPLAAIQVYGRGCLLQLENGATNKDKIKAALEKIALQTEHAGKILHQMKNFIRQGELCLENLDISLVIKQALDVLDHKVDILLNIKLSTDESLPLIAIDKTKIKQVILNLVQNSIEAAQDHTIREINIGVEIIPMKHCIEVHFRDDGPGIADDISQKVLNFYFTTKPYGTGLGLPICKMIIEAHGGELTIKPSKKGAWLCFILPIKNQDPIGRNTLKQAP